MNLDDYRNEIDRIDREIIRLLQERKTFAGKIGAAKKAAGVALYAPGREESLLARLEGLAMGALPRKAVRAIFREIISLCIGTQMERPVVYLGPEGAYTQQAAVKNFGSSVPMYPLRTLRDVFAAVERGEAALGVVPIENSTEGAIGYSLDMLVESELKIVAQIFLGMDHCLLGRGPLTEVKRVFADDLALAQCRDWIQRNLPAAELVTTESTADSVRLAGTDATAAVVAGAAVASLYDVPVLVRGIQDKRDNITRFLIIGTKVSPPRTDCEYKTSLVLTLKHSPGTLQKALLPLSAGGLNITRIDSRPNRQRAWEYLFFIDITGHWEDAAVQDAMAALRESCSMVKWLGSYLNSQE